MTEIETKTPPVKTLIVCPQTTGDLSAENRLEETVSLAAAIKLEVVHAEIVKLRQIKADAYLGTGVIERLREIAEENEVKLFIIDAIISPIQQRNLEKALMLKVIDRTALILEIFGERAQTKEGVLQVELAHLTYQRSRLVRSWTHLERQRGGAGFLGGPGETQIELDRRIIDEKIIKIKKALEKIKQTRALQRSARKRVPYPIVALVGYTNTGKSTLFNRLTNSNVFAQDLLFATLDTTMRRLKLPSGREIIISDTVGFISDLPHELVMAFRATLEEVLEADVVLQILDASNADCKKQRVEVLEVLHQLGLEQIEHKDNYIEVYNKIDAVSEEQQACLQNTKSVVAVSALEGTGCDVLLQRVDQALSKDFIEVDICLSVEDGKSLSWFYQNAEIIKKKLKDDKLMLKVKLPKHLADYAKNI